MFDYNQVPLNSGIIQPKQKPFYFWLGLSIILFILFSSSHHPAIAQGNFKDNSQPATAFEAKVFNNVQGQTIPYRFLTPLSPVSNVKRRITYPLVLFLHGSGERGADNLKQLNYILRIFEEPLVRKLYPSFVVAPQCPKGQNWVYKESYTGTVPQSPQPTQPMLLTVELLHRLQKDYPIDPRRIYVIGLSSGGSGTWDLIGRYPKLFAAASPFSGCGDAHKAPLMVGTPIWAFHGARDIVVNPNTTRMMIQAITKAGGHPKFTEYPALYHNTWNKTFHDPTFFQWLFAQRKA